MVIGYYDGRGYDSLIAGDASIETAAVDQAIASGGNSSAPVSPEQHYEDYARPQDHYPNPLPDDYITQGRTPHQDNCIADFMKTSRSNHPSGPNYYGWNWSSDVKPAFEDYVARVAPYYSAMSIEYAMGSTLTFNLIKAEIDAGRPMVFLVDSNQDGETDHFVPVIGYADGPPASYIYYDTWTQIPHQAEFRPMSTAYAWGVWEGWTFHIEGGDGFSFSECPHGGWFNEGDTLALRVAVAGTVGSVTYQWRKDGADLPGETWSSYGIDSLGLDDTGWYSCRVTDGGKSVRETDPVHVQVFPMGSLPAMGVAGLCLLAAASFSSGVRALCRAR
jgi:hypothetical protein